MRKYILMDIINQTKNLNILFFLIFLFLSINKIKLISIYFIRIKKLVPAQ